MIDNPELLKASITLSKYVAQNTTQAIGDKIRTSKAKKNNEETINSLEEIINKLISEKNELISIAQIYDEQLISQKISDDDINYITHNLLPLLESFIKNGEEDKLEGNLQKLEAIKPLLSRETFNILQLLGFNFKKAIGEPLTQLINGLITSQIPTNSEKVKEYEIINAQREVEYFRILQDEESFQRLLEIKNGK